MYEDLSTETPRVGTRFIPHTDPLLRLDQKDHHDQQQDQEEGVDHQQDRHHRFELAFGRREGGHGWGSDLGRNRYRHRRRSGRRCGSVRHHNLGRGHRRRSDGRHRRRHDGREHGSRGRRRLSRRRSRRGACGWLDRRNHARKFAGPGTWRRRGRRWGWRRGRRGRNLGKALQQPGYASWLGSRGFGGPWRRIRWQRRLRPVGRRLRLPGCGRRTPRGSQ
jgi:hypothetical protein